MKKFLKVKASNSYSRSNRRRIVASTQYAEDIHPALANFESKVYDAGYNLTVQGDSLQNVAFTLTADKDVDMMPRLTVWLDTSDINSTGIIYFECTADFPRIDTRNLDFGDSSEYWIKDQWGDKVGKFITWMQKNPIILDEWEEN